MSAARSPAAENTRSSRTLAVAAALLFAAVLGGLSWRLYQHRPTEAVSLERWALASYRDVIYFPLVALGDGVNPYDSVRDGNPERYMERYPVADHLPLYSPLVLALFAPFGALPAEASMVAFAALNCLLFVLLAWCTLRIIGRRPTVAGVFALSALLLASQPGRGAFNAGQIAVPLALAMLGALQWGDRHAWRSGLMVALATMKPTFGGPFGVMLAARRDWRSAIGGLTVGGVVFAAGLAAIVARTGELSVDSVMQVVSGNHAHLANDPEAVPRTNKARTDLAAIFEYLTAQSTPRWASMVLAAGVLGISCAALWKNRHSCEEDTAASPASAMIIVATFICIFHNVYDLPLLIVPLAASATAAGSGWRSLGAARRYSIAALLAAPFVNIFWTQGFRTLVGQLGVPWGEDAGPLFAAAYRLACAANGLALLGVWGLLVHSMLFRRSSIAVAANTTTAGGQATLNGDVPPSELFNDRQSLHATKIGGWPITASPGLTGAMHDQQAVGATRETIQ